MEATLFGVYDKVETAIQRLRVFEPPEGYYLAFSGGKDSQCIYHLCKEADVRFDAHYSLTTVDPPEAVYFIRIAELRSACKKSFSSVSREISQMLHKAAIAEKRKQYRSQLQESAVIRYFF